ncbi:PH domain-containing protein [Rufibacter sp. DG15C]|uniref:PH domain-containing protein n=1 Tax=Rufibacter sp. DG15C TaxID=1379909 RepID=UPI0008355EF4|nr:PH domain-containing protein [Rufibacter sp. DG15C]
MDSTRTFTSSKSWFVSLALLGTSLFLAVMTIQDFLTAGSLAGKLIFLGFSLAMIGLLLWTWFGTYYRVAGHHLYYRCGPLHGRIPIQEIRIVKQKERLWSGLRPALGLHGLILHYHKWDEIYLSPKDKEAFVKALQEINPSIQVK